MELQTQSASLGWKITSNLFYKSQFYYGVIWFLSQWNPTLTMSPQTRMKKKGKVLRDKLRAHIVSPKMWTWSIYTWHFYSTQLLGLNIFGLRIRFFFLETFPQCCIFTFAFFYLVELWLNLQFYLYKRSITNLDILLRFCVWNYNSLMIT